MLKAVLSQLFNGTKATRKPLSHRRLKTNANANESACDLQFVVVGARCERMSMVDCMFQASFCGRASKKSTD